jgi:DAK2 domain fusion protein YloV
MVRPGESARQAVRAVPPPHSLAGVREVLDAAAVRRWCRLAADALGRTRREIDALNVFPVPDGDTGTNLHLTVLAAVEALDELPDAADAGAAWAALAHGALLGARGNSGIILSQVFRGLADVLGAGGPRPDGAAFARALAHAAALARAAVAHPVEGTILSVLDAASEAAGAGRSLAAAALAAARRARGALERTTGQLAVLASNGVVDAGAAGLCVVLDALAAAVGERPAHRYAVPPKTAAARPGAVRPEALGPDAGPEGGREGDRGAAGAGGPARPDPAPPGGTYEVMYLLDAADDAVPLLRAALDRIGDSLVVVGGGGLWNVHVHVDDAGAAIESALAAGHPHRIRVTYLPTGGRAGVGGDPARAPAGRGVVAVTSGPGLADLFERAGARVVTADPGGGALPPPTLLLDRILESGAEVVVLPNDPAMIAVAEAAAEPARERGARVAVVPTEAPVQGLAALAVHDPAGRFDDDVAGMISAAEATRHGRLEVAGTGEVAAFVGAEPIGRGTDMAALARRLLDRMLAAGGELVTLVLGAGAGPDLGAALADHLRARHPGAEVTSYDGGQDGRPLLVGVE